MAIKTKAQLKEYIRQDYYRNYGVVSKTGILKETRKQTTVNLLIQYRICNYCCNMQHKSISVLLMHVMAYHRFKKLQQQCGIELNQHTEIGPGLRLPHKYGIIIHPQAVIGENCEIMNDVTLGNNILKDRDAVPYIGNNVLICTGSKVIGGINVGDNVVVGANSVVNRDVVGGVVVAGAPARVIKNSDPEVYVINNYGANSNV